MTGNVPKYWWGKKLFQEESGGKKLVIEWHSKVSCNINGEDSWGTGV